MLKKLYLLKKKASNHEEGFTLIELMIVIVIIGILAAIAILIFANQQKSAMEAGVKSDTANARSVIPATPHGVKTPERFATEVTITEDNLGRYFVNQTQSEACYDVSNTTDTETFVYRYATNIGKIEAASCDDWVTNNPGGSSVSIESTPTGPETTSPAVTIPTPRNGNASGGGEFNGSDYGLTTNPYLSISSFRGLFGDTRIELEITPYNGPVDLSSWSVTWQDPNITGINDNPLGFQVSSVICSVATGGIITCANNPNADPSALEYLGTQGTRYQLGVTKSGPINHSPTFYIATELA